MIDTNKSQLDLMKRATEMFRASSNILRSLGETIRPLDPHSGVQKIDIGVTVSSVVLYAFTCEVGLKTLYFKEQGKEICEHDLQILFKQLSTDVRTRIETQVMARNLEGGTNDFTTLLNDNRKIFLQWRYFYEKKNKKVPASLSFLKEFSNAICMELNRGQ